MSRSNGIRWPSREDELLATCARIAFGESEQAKVLELCRPGGIRWGKVYSTARLHGVAPLVYRNLAELDPEDLRLDHETLERFRRSFGRNLARNQYLQDGLWRILGFFNSQKLDVMLIKGAAMGLLSDGAGLYTQSRDVDLIVRAREDEIPAEILKQIFEIPQWFPLEFDFYGHHDVDLNGVLPIDWERVWADAIPVHYSGRDLFVMSPEDALIAACLNACRKRYFNLKALCGIASQLSNSKVLWWKVVGDKSGYYRVSDIIYAATLATSTVMDIPIPRDLEECLGTTRLKAYALKLLARRFSFSSFSTLYSGPLLANRRVGTSMMLPYASYRGGQIWRKLRFATKGGLPEFIAL